MKTVKYKFFIDDIVKIPELGLKGRVLSVWTGRRGNEIQVRLFINGKAEEIYFYEDELTEIQK